MKKHKIPLEVAPPSPADEIGYWRVSTGRDQTPDMQIAAMKRRGLLDDNIYGDIASGRKAKRPQLIMAIKAMRPGGTLVVWKLDRLGRDTMELYRIAKEFEAEGQNIVSMTEAIDTRTAMGRAFFGMLAVFAQFESDTTKERTAAGMARARENGSQVGAKTKFTTAQWAKLEKSAAIAPRPPAFCWQDSGQVRRFIGFDPPALSRLARKDKIRAGKISAGKPAANQVGSRP